MTRRGFLRAAGLGALSGVATAAFGDFTAKDVEFVHRELRLPRWDADGFRLGLISDIHANNAYEAARARGAVTDVVAAKPDLIVLAGDFANQQRDAIFEHIRHSLEPLHDSSCPVVGVMGNHDYWIPHPEKIFRTVSGSNVAMLQNERFDVGQVAVIGLDDALVHRCRPDALLDHSLPKSVIAVLHEPDYIDEIPSKASLQLSGHSHGGQICLPGGIPLDVPPGARKYYSGFYPDAPTPLYVSRGVGTTGPSLRLFCRPEVSILTLRSA